jgi:Kef-type K+ transport system membrane component KefB
MPNALQSLIQQPWSLAPDTLLGAVLLGLVAALVGETVWRVLHWPRLVGYAIVGTLIAVVGRGVDGGDERVRLLVDAALGVLLFEAGARLNLRWLRHNPWLLASSLLESAITALVVVIAAQWLGVPQSVAIPLALILVASSPALTMRVVGELGSAGQVTERLLAMSVLNTLYAVIALQLYGAGMLLSVPDTWTQAIGPVMFSFFGSFLLAALTAEAIHFAARRFDLRHDPAVLLIVGFVMLALVLAKTLHLSMLTVPLLAGIWLRNRSDRPWLWPRHFGSLGALLVLALFVAVSAAWSPRAVAPLVVVALALVLLRVVAKIVGVTLLARPSGLRASQGLWLGVAMMPLSATTWVLGLDFAAQQGSRAEGLLPLVLACIALFELVSPLVLRFALQRAGDVERRTMPVAPPAVPSPPAASAPTTTPPAPVPPSSGPQSPTGSASPSGPVSPSQSAPPSGSSFPAGGAATALTARPEAAVVPHP